MTTDIPKNILFRFASPDGDPNSDLCDEYAVVKRKSPIPEIVIYGRHKRTGLWMPGDLIRDWLSQYVIERLLRLLAEVQAQHSEPCRPDHNRFCQEHLCSSPCLYGRIREMTGPFTAGPVAPTGLPQQPHPAVAGIPKTRSRPVSASQSDPSSPTHSKPREP